MKKILNYTIAMLCMVMAFGCSNGVKDMAYSYTNPQNGDVTVIRLYEKKGKVLITKFSAWEIEQHQEELYLCYGKAILGASYQQLDDVINIMQHNEITDKIILQEDGGLRYKADVYWPDKRFKDIKPVGKYGGKAYIANLSEGDGAIYLAFINERKLYYVVFNAKINEFEDVKLCDYEISGKKILVSDLDLFFEEEGENFLIMNTGWSYVTFKSIGELDDYKLWEDVLSEL